MFIPGFWKGRVVTYISSLASFLKEAGTVYPSGAPLFIPGFGGVRVGTYISNTASVLIIRSRNCLSFRSSCVHPRVLGGSVLLHI